MDFIISSLRSVFQVTAKSLSVSVNVWTGIQDEALFQKVQSQCVYAFVGVLFSNLTLC
jgi:hypothetical protein